MSSTGLHKVHVCKLWAKDKYSISDFENQNSSHDYIGWKYDPESVMRSKTIARAPV